MLYNINKGYVLARVKKNGYLCKLFYVYYVQICGKLTLNKIRL